MTDKLPGPFFKYDPTTGAYSPRQPAISYWDSSKLFGPPVCGAIARELETRVESDYVPGRVSIDLCAGVPAKPLTIRIIETSSSKRVDRFAVDVRCGDSVVAQATATYVAATGEPAGACWQNELSPIAIPSSESRGQAAGRPLFDSDGSERHWTSDMRQHTNESRKRTWLDGIELVHNERASGFVVGCFLAEQASFVTNWGSAGIEFINLDVSIAFARIPSDAGLGIEALAHSEHNGVAFGAGVLYDDYGPVAVADTVSILNRKSTVST